MTVWELERKLPVRELMQWFEYFKEPDVKDKPTATAKELLNHFGLE